jgi:hypothetical protein
MVGERKTCKKLIGPVELLPFWRQGQWFRWRVVPKVIVIVIVIVIVVVVVVVVVVVRGMGMGMGMELGKSRRWCWCWCGQRVCCRVRRGRRKEGRRQLSRTRLKMMKRPQRMLRMLRTLMTMLNTRRCKRTGVVWNRG